MEKNPERFTAMDSKGATTLELNVSLLIELDDDARTELVAEIQKEWKALLHQTTLKIMSLDKKDDGLRRIASKVTSNPSLVDLNAQRDLREASEDLAPVLELVPDLEESSINSDRQVS